MLSKHPFVNGETLIVAYFEKYSILGSSLAIHQYMEGPAYANQISGFTALPGINNKMSRGLLDGIYWAPQIVCTFLEQLLPVLE